MFILLFYQELTYSFTRIKDIEYEQDVKLLFMYVKLSITKKQALGSTTRHQEITTFSEIVRIPMSDAPVEYLQLSDDDYFIEIPKETYDKLLKLTTEDFVAFASYTQ